MFPTVFVYDGGFVSDDNFAEVIDNLDRLGAGISRKVYALDADHVIKIPLGAETECNLRERDFWEMVQGTSAERYFAKVHACSEFGEWLVMDRVETIGRETGETASEVFPYRALEKIGMDDMHDGNWGVMWDGTPKWIDFGYAHPGRRISVEKIDQIMSDYSDESAEYESNCCTECDQQIERERHMDDSCEYVHGTGCHVHTSCRACGKSRCDTSEHRMARQSVPCDADGCYLPAVDRLSLYVGESVNLCDRHLPDWGPMPHNPNQLALWTGTYPRKSLPNSERKMGEHLASWLARHPSIGKAWDEHLARM